jgi:hypothetical protein
MSSSAHGPQERPQAAEPPWSEKPIRFYWDHKTTARKRMRATLEAKLEDDDADDPTAALEALDRLQTRLVIHTVGEAEQLLEVLENPIETYGQPTPDAKILLSYDRVQGKIIDGLENRGYTADGATVRPIDPSEPSEPFEPYRR